VFVFAVSNERELVGRERLPPVPSLSDDILQVLAWDEVHTFSTLDDGVEHRRDIGAVDGFTSREILAPHDHMPERPFRIIVR
jgi:hypothetical protein